MTELIVFDLDGTLVNSYNTIYKTTLKTLNELEIIHEMDEKEFYNRIGHHFLDIFNDLKVNVPDIEHFINIYKSYYFDFIDESTLYPDVVETIKEIKAKGLKVALLTTKAQDQADKIIDLFELRQYFDEVMGRRSDLKIKPHPEPLEWICNKLGVNVENTIMVGDSELDVRCGKAAKTKTAAVTFGYRNLDQLKNEEPDYYLNNLKDILEVLEK